MTSLDESLNRLSQTIIDQGIQRMRQERAIALYIQDLEHAIMEWRQRCERLEAEIAQLKAKEGGAG